MKKLIALIGAAATAFGLYAADVVTDPKVGFETDETGFSDPTAVDWEAAGWTGGTDGSSVVGYEAAGLAKYGYGVETNARRIEFGSDANNLNFLKLETGTNTLSHGVTKAGTVYFDQLVQFTGFEEAQTNLAAGTKIAVWLSAIETEDYVPAYTDEGGEFHEATGIQGETNLYVTCGNAAGEQVALKIDGNYQPDKWYRVTIKSLGDILPADALSRLGFIVYIDGVQVGSSDPAATTLLEAGTLEGNDLAATYLANGQLFPSIDASSTTISSFGYCGIGKVDDVVADNRGPDFARLCDIEFLPIEGAKITKITDADGRVWEDAEGLTGEFSVKKGDITVWLTADEGWIVKVASQPVNISGDSTEVEVDLSGVVKVFAEVAHEGLETAKYAEADLYDMMDSLVDGDEVTFTQVGNVTNGEEEIVYAFTPGTTIAVDGTDWTLQIVSYFEDEEEEVSQPGAFEILTDVVNNIAVMVEDADSLTLGENITIAEGASLDASEFAMLQTAGDITVAGTLKLANAEGLNGQFDLTSKGKVIAPEDVLTAENFVDDEDDLDPKTEDGFTTWQLKGGIEFVIDVPENVTVTGVEGAKYDEASKKYTADAAGTELQVSLKADDGFLFSNGLDTFTVTTVTAEGKVEITEAPTKAGFAIIIADADPVYYPTLDAAIAAYTGDGAVTLLANCERADWIVVDKAVAIDLNGYSITVPDVAAFRANDVTNNKRDSLFVVLHGGALTIDDTSVAQTGLIDVSGDARIYSVVKMTKPLDTDETNVAAFTLNGGTLKGYYYGITGSGNTGRGNTTITINDGTVMAVNTNDSVGIYNPQGNSTLTINGGTVQGASGVYIKAGICKCEVGSDATIKGVGAKLPYTPNSDGCNATGDAIILDNCGYPGGSPLAEIEAGTFISDNAAAVASYAKPNTGLEPVVGFVSGGKFKGEVALDNAIVKLDTGDTAGKWVTDEDGFLVPYSFVAVAQVGDEKYETLAEAVAAATENDTVTLLADVTLTETLEIVDSTAINLAGKKVTFAADLTTGLYAHDAGAIVVSNGEFAVATGRENIAGSKAIYLLRTSAEFTDVKIDVPGFDYALTHMGNIADKGKDRNEYWTVDTPYELDCNNVAVKGNGSLFHLEYVAADLDEDCTAVQYEDKGYFSAAHQAAIYSSCGAVVTVNGGTYTAVNALQTGNLGGDIIVNGGTFNGDIMSFMYKGDDRWTDNVASITITNGTFNGEFAFAQGQAAECTKDEVTWNITGGKFKDDPSDYLVDPYVATYDQETKYYSVAQSEEPVDNTEAQVEIDGVTTVTNLHDALVVGSVEGAVVTLLKNVDLDNKPWEPIANFSGTFDGAGYTISNLYIEKESGDNVGLIANSKRAGENAQRPVVKNIVIDGIYVNAPNSQFVGGIVGHSFPLLITNVTVRGNIKIAGKKYVGGIDGHPSATIIDCKVIGDGAATSFIGANTTEAAQVGGIYGMGAATEAVLVYNCSVEGVTIQAKEHVGGIGGRMQGDAINVNCSVKDVIVKGGTNVGSLIGQPYGYESATCSDYLLNCTADNVALQDADGQAIADAEYGTSFGSATQLNFVKSSDAVGAGIAAPAGKTFGLTGGTFTIVSEWTSKPGQAVANLAAQCATGYAPFANDDGTYTVMMDPVAMIDETGYPTLEAAFADAQANDTIKLVKNVVLGNKLTVNGFDGILDLNGYSITNAVAYTGGAKFLIDVVESDLTISNGTIFVTGNMVYARTNSVITIASDATINSEAGGGTPNTFRLYGDGATLNVYGTINKIGVEGGAIDQCVGSSIVNVYEGAKIKSNGYIFKISVGAGNAPVVNVYGGELEMTSNYAGIYAYNNNTATINLLGGDFIITAEGGKDNKLFAIQADKQTVTGLGADSAVRFSRKSNVADFCAEGYEPVLVDGWYVIKQLHTVTLKNGDAVVDTQVVVDGQFATNVVLDVEGFKGWTNETCTAAFDFEKTAITADVTLFAWIEAAGPVYPQDLPDEFPADADQAVKDKYVDWAKTYGVTDATGLSDAFLMNADPNGTIPTLKIESIAVEGDTATIVVSAEGVDLEKGINGKLYVSGCDDLGGEWVTTDVELPKSFNDGAATFTVDAAKFMKAKVGFKVEEAPTK